MRCIDEAGIRDAVDIPLEDMTRTVILTDRQGTSLGSSGIVEAHTGQGKLHKAFSVYVFRKNGTELLMQRRSAQKMLWPLFWANTCCSHPFIGEDARTAGERRLREELGFCTALSEHGFFVYRAEDPGGRGIEHEHVTILTGEADDALVHPDPVEVADWRWVGIAALRTDMEQHPSIYAPWFPLGLRLLTS